MEAAAQTSRCDPAFAGMNLRHDFGTKFLRATGNLKLTQKAMNHSDINTTLKYAHVLDSEVAEALERVHPPGRSPGNSRLSGDFNRALYWLFRNHVQTARQMRVSLWSAFERSSLRRERKRTKSPGVEQKVPHNLPDCSPPVPAVLR